MFFQEFATWIWRLFIVVDPIFAGLILIALTKDLNRTERQHIANRAWCIAFTISLTSFFFGQLLLERCGISHAALYLGGGLLLAKYGLSLIEGQESVELTGDDIAVVPLAMPLIAGPADIIIHVEAYTHYSMGTLCAVLTMQLLVYLCLRFAAECAEFINGNMSKIYSAIGGLVTLLLGMQFLLDGINIFLNVNK